MNTREQIRRIDEWIKLGKRILTVQLDGASAEKPALDATETFFRGIKSVIEDVYGEGNGLSDRFEGMHGCDPRKVEEGLATLEDLRRLTIYSGEFSS